MSLEDHLDHVSNLPLTPAQRKMLREEFGYGVKNRKSKSYSARDLAITKSGAGFRTAVPEKKEGSVDARWLRRFGSPTWVLIDTTKTRIDWPCRFCAHIPQDGEWVLFQYLQSGRVIVEHETCLMGQLALLPPESFYKIKERLEGGGNLFNDD